ncbi:MAG TPA: hypothetical protein VFZ61_20395, partial [Polyangiales bacterium]
TGTVLMKQYSELMLARVIACRGRVEDALALLAPLAHSLDANVAFGAKVFMAEAHARAGAFSLGLAHAGLVDAAPTSPYWHALMAALARCRLALGQPAEARALCTRALELPHTPAPEYEADLQVSRAEALLQLGDAVGARRELSRAVAFTESIARCMRDPAVRTTFLENVEAHARARVLTEQLWR